jgi:molecular chaperone GrpE
MTKGKKQEELEQHINELTGDVQRVRADFENYRKRVEQEKEMARASGRVGAILKLLPVIDNIERAINHVPEELQDNAWAQGVGKLVKNLDKSLADMGVTRISAKPGDRFDPELHEAVQFDDDADGEHEVVAEELQAGYKLGDDVIRHSMVKVTKK